MIPSTSRRKIVYDIDEVLCTCNVSTLKQVAFFAKHGLIITAIKTHYVFPGVVELMKASFDEPDTDIYFSSRGEEARNNLFIKKLLDVSLGFERAQKVKYVVHTMKRKIYVNDPPESKDLNEICGESRNSTLVDDQSSNIHPGQFKNFLYVYETRFNEFSHYCDSDGYVPISLDTHGSASVYHMSLYGGLKVNVKSLTVKITYQNKKTREKEHLELTHEKHSELIDKIKKANKVDVLEQTCRKEIVALVEDAGGLTRKIDRLANHLFYYVGILFSALNENKKTGEPISDFLYRVQWRQNVEGYEGSINQNIFWSIYDENYYEYGLSVLRKYNTNLTFMTPMKYKEATQVQLTPELKQLYQAYIDNNVNDW